MTAVEAEAITIKRWQRRCPGPGAIPGADGYDQGVVLRLDGEVEEGEVERRTLDHMKETWMAKGTGDTAHLVTGMHQLWALTLRHGHCCISRMNAELT